MAMNDGPVLSDDGIRELLENRAGRAEIDGRLAVVRAAAAATPQRRIGGLRFGFGIGRGPAAGAASLASLGILVIALALAFGWRLPLARTGSGPSGSTATEQSGGPPATPVVPGAAEPVLPLSVDQLNALLAAEPQSLSGRQLVITGTIDPINMTCFGGPSSCAPAVLRGSQPVLSVEPVGASETRFQSSLQNSLSGPFAAHLVDGSTLQYEGPVEVGSDGVPLLPSELPDPADQGLNSGYQLVRGWIAGIADPSPCPLPRYTPPPGPQYGCGLQAILSDDAYQPVTSNSFVMPPTGILVQNGAYQDFAPEPALQTSSNPPGARLTEPEQATFLVRVAPSETVSCPPASPCPVIYLWAIQARVDPWSGPRPVSNASPSAEPSASMDGALPAVSPLTVNQLNAYLAMNSQSPAGRQLVITGTIEAETKAFFCSGACTGYFLEGTSPMLWVDPGKARGAPPWTEGIPINGAFAAVLTDNLVLDYQAAVSLTPDGLPWLPSQLPIPTAETTTSGDWLVHGWITGSVGGPVCPPSLAVAAPDGAQYGCGSPAHLEDTDVPPGTVPLPTSPLSGVPVQNGAYGGFAPNVDASNPVPEQATFLVRMVAVSSCPPSDFCPFQPAHFYWEIVARIDPWPVPALP
jgi:hypothetical protein